MLAHIDQQLLLFLNSLNSPFWDKVMWIISGRLTWVPLYLAILYVLAFRYRRKMYVLVLLIAITVASGDRLSVMIKNAVKRPRPCHEQLLEGRIHIVNGSCGGLYGFVSSHATNAFSVALLSLLLIRKRWFSVTMIFWALLVGYSRIYLGVHYPGDVLSGSLLGALIGWAVYSLWCYLDNRWLKRSLYFNPV
jgi:undecaprenyl-diphosphatase